MHGAYLSGIDTANAIKGKMVSYFYFMKLGQKILLQLKILFYRLIELLVLLALDTSAFFY